jgi:hypothetical protein
MRMNLKSVARGEMVRSIFAVLAVLMLSACATMPGGVNVSKSEFDGSTQVTTNPGWCENGVKMALSWNSKMPPDTLRLDAMAPGGGDIAAGQSLHFNIDGKIIDLASYDEKSDIIVQEPFANRMVVIPGEVWARKSYLISPKLADELLQAQKVTYRLDLFKDYKEGAVQNGPTTAMSGFRDLMVEYRMQQH